MRADKNRTHLFYQDHKISTVKTGDSIRRLLRYGEILLTEKSSVSDLALLATSLSGSVLMVAHDDQKEIRNYSCYGVESNTQSQENSIGFNGEIFDSTTQCYALGNGYRLFSPAAMRFHSPDNLSPFDSGGINAYCYCLGDPANNIDPSGHNPGMILTALANLSEARDLLVSSRKHLVSVWSTSLEHPVLDSDYRRATVTINHYRKVENNSKAALRKLGVGTPSYTPEQKVINQTYSKLKAAHAQFVPGPTTSTLTSTSTPTPTPTPTKNPAK